MITTKDIEEMEFGLDKNKKYEILKGNKIYLTNFKYVGESGLDNSFVTGKETVK